MCHYRLDFIFGQILPLLDILIDPVPGQCFLSVCYNEPLSRLFSTMCNGPHATVVYPCIGSEIDFVLFDKVGSKFKHSNITSLVAFLMNMTIDFLTLHVLYKKLTYSLLIRFDNSPSLY